MDVTQEIEQAAQAGADHCALCSISCVTSTLALVYVLKRAATLFVVERTKPIKLTLHCYILIILITQSN